MSSLTKDGGIGMDDNIQYKNNPNTPEGPSHKYIVEFGDHQGQRYN